MKKIVISLALLSAVSVAQAEINLSDCIIQQVIPPKNMTGAFLKIDNQTNEMVDILDAAIPSITSQVELHEMKVENNVMTMQEIPVYSLAPGMNEFRKGGYHLMLMNIEHKPQVGERHTLTLNLSNGERPSCEATVLSVEEVMAKFDANQHSAPQNSTPWQIQMGRHHSVEEMNEHHQSGAMSGQHHSVEEMNEHHQSNVMPAPHHSVEEMNEHHQSAVMPGAHHGQINSIDN